MKNLNKIKFEVNVVGFLYGVEEENLGSLDKT